METFGQTVRYSPCTTLSPRDRVLRTNLTVDCMQKMADRLGIHVSVHVEPRVATPDIDPAKLLDELVDMLYVVIGTACTMGLQDKLERAFAEVHRANMSKVGPDGKVIRNDLGKVVKGPNFQRADLSSIINSEESCK